MEVKVPPWRVLSIDDEQSVHDTYRAILCEDEYEQQLDALLGEVVSEPVEEPKEVLFQLDSELSGEAGYQRVEQALEEGNPFAVIFLDMRMPPGWDGLKTAEMVRGIDPAVRIILITAYADYELSEIRERIGNDFIFMNKPVTKNELLQVTTLFVKQWSHARQLQSSEPESHVRLQQGDEVPNVPLEQGRSAQLQEQRVQILLVDDSPTILAVYSFLLQRNDGYEVMVAEGVDEAQEVVEEFQPDIAIIDYLMPEKDGCVLASALQQHPATDHCKILFFALKSEVKLISCGVMQHEVIYKDDPTEVFLHQIAAIAQTVSVQKALGQRVKQQAEEKGKKQVEVAYEVESVSQHQHWLEAILNSIAEVVVVVDLAGRVLYTNSSAVNRLGYQSGQLNGVPLQQLVEGIEPGLSEADCLLRCGNGRTFQAHYSRSPLMTSDEQPQHGEGEVLVFHLSNE
ncbi:MAG: response regulator [Gammaproteobacteria bacterium]|jgi:CheY-like chemotaxis protein|nr:response regulator [Gammaproteobacteria bacterium]